MHLNLFDVFPSIAAIILTDLQITLYLDRESLLVWVSLAVCFVLFFSNYLPLWNGKLFQAPFVCFLPQTSNSSISPRNPGFF